MEHPLGQSDYGNATQQHLGIEQSRLEKTQVGGQAGRDLNLAGRDIYNTTVNHGEEDFPSIDDHLRGQEKILKEQFQEKLDAIASLVEELREGIYRALDSVAFGNTERIKDLLDQLAGLAGVEADFEQIQRNRKYYYEAAAWLDENMNILVQYSINHAFIGRDYPPYYDSKNAFIVRNSEARQSFGEDIKAYFAWIKLHLLTTTIPRNFDKKHVKLFFQDDVYKNAFTKIKYDAIGSAHNSGELSAMASQVLIRYINRFLLKRDIDSDR